MVAKLGLEREHSSQSCCSFAWKSGFNSQNPQGERRAPILAVSSDLHMCTISDTTHMYARAHVHAHTQAHTHIHHKYINKEEKEVLSMRTRNIMYF